jgi:hypothetical protein
MVKKQASKVPERVQKTKERIAAAEGKRKEEHD